MAANNQFISNFRESSAENNVDLGVKFVTKEYLIDVYPYLSGLGNIQFAGLFSWGNNSIGQIGDNTTTDKSSPFQTIAYGTNWKQISTDHNSTAAIKTDGTLWLWGRNSSGQLGDNSTTSRSSPVQTIAFGTNWKQVSCGYLHTAAIKTDGTLWTWGHNNGGQLGDNTRTNKSSPVQTITFGTNWKQVSCGYHTAAIKTDGTLWTWGYNLYGQLGNNTANSTSSPVQTIAFGTNWKQVSAGQDHTIAIKTDGTLWACGGYNNDGRLGDNSTTPKSSPVQTIAFGTNWKQVDAGRSHTAAIKTDGTLWTWGDNTGGRLGDNTTTPKSSPVQTITFGTNWKQVSTGAHTAAVKTDGTLWVWGRNMYGQLGDNTTTPKSSPVQTITFGTNWKQVSCGYFHTAAIQEMGDDF
jgi:alpha-tubulin suppressor-like RCC1 family protein